MHKGFPLLVFHCSLRYYGSLCSLLVFPIHTYLGLAFRVTRWVGDSKHPL